MSFKLSSPLASSRMRTPLRITAFDSRLAGSCSAVKTCSPTYGFGDRLDDRASIVSVPGSERDPQTAIATAEPEIMAWAADFRRNATAHPTTVRNLPTVTLSNVLV